MNRYEGLTRAFVGLADTLVADFDVVELAQQLVDSAMELLPIDAAGIVLADAPDTFQVLASSSEQPHVMELFQIQGDEGPWLQSYRTGQHVIVDDLRTDPQHWPEFALRALDHGFLSVHALPLRLRTDHVGVLNLLRFETGTMSDADLALGQALADVATIGIVHQRIAMQSETLNQQLQTALNTRTVIEQAKGVIAERGRADMDTAFKLLRGYARSNNLKLVDVAHIVVNGGDTGPILGRS